MYSNPMEEQLLEKTLIQESEIDISENEQEETPAPFGVSNEQEVVEEDDVLPQFVETVQDPPKKVKPKKKMNKKASETVFIILMLLFPVLQFIIFWLVPNIDSIIMGFQDAKDGTFTLQYFKKFWANVTAEPDFLGKKNELSYAIKNSLIYFAVNIFFCTPLVIFFSYILFKRVPLNGAFKVIFYLPSIVGGTITATLYRALLQEGAPIYELLYRWGFITEEMAQLSLFGHDSTAFLMVIIYSIWTCVGINMIMFYGAMKRIPNEIFESAEIDGVGFFRQFISIVVPLIWPTISTLIIFSLSGMFVSYGSVMILTPQIGSASMIGWYIVHYTTASDNMANLNYPAAVGLIFTIIGLPFVLFVRWLLGKIGSDVEY